MRCSRGFRISKYRLFVFVSIEGLQMGFDACMAWQNNGLAVVGRAITCAYSANVANMG